MTTTPMPAPRCPTLVYGAPGAGKTVAAVETVLDFLRSGEDSRRLLVLSPTRTSAARLRDRTETRWAQESPAAALSEQPSRSFASYAFWVLSEARRRGFISFSARTPRLLSGAEQDRIIADIVAELTAEAGTESWPASLKQAVPTEGFRKEIRELFDRAREYGITASRLEALALEHVSEEWHTAAIIYSRYLERFHSEEFEDAYDPAGLISEAARLLEQNPDLLAAERHRLMLIVVDDLQEAGPSVYRLLRLIGAGRPVLAFANPDAVTQGFRGARPDKLKGWETLMAPDPPHGLHGSSPEVQVLPGAHRMAADIGTVYARTLTRITAPGVAELRRIWQPLLERPETDTETCALALAVPSDHAAERAVLAEILNRCDRHGVAFQDIAVIARSGASTQRIARVLSGHGIPVQQSMSEVILHEEPAVAPLLRIVDLLTGDGELELDDVLALMSSRYGGTDALGLRKVRQQLRRGDRTRAERERTEVRNREPVGSDDLILAAVRQSGDPVLAGIAWRNTASGEESQAYGLKRIADMVQAGQQALQNEQRRPAELLWAIWHASGVSDIWREATRHPGREAEQANQDLDAVLALFQAADRFEDQNPGLDAGFFAEHLQRLELPMDTLAETVATTDAVAVLTPSTAAGREFDTVILLDLQQGVWPNLRPRGELLRSRELVDVVEGSGGSVAQNPLVKRMQTLQDEYRLFASAVSRARNRLFAVAVDTDEDRPSPLLDIITPADQRAAPNAAHTRPLTAGHLVAELRRDLEQSFQQDSADEIAPAQAAQALAALAQHGIPGADPRGWWGLAELSSAEPVIGPEEELRLSPSTIGTAVDQPLEWFVGAAGGTTATDFSRMLGTLIHKIAEDHPHETDLDVLTELLTQQWELLDHKQGWQEVVEWQKATDMLRQLAQYHQESNTGRELIARELRLSTHVRLPGGAGQTATISGTVDRVEKTPDGALLLVDLKTGSRAPTEHDTERHAQLGAYQLLVAGNDFTEHTGIVHPPVAGAALVYVAANRNVTVRWQRPVDTTAEDSWPRRLIAAAAQTMQSNTFEVRHAAAGSWGSRCRVGPLCPLCQSGKQVTQP